MDTFRVLRVGALLFAMFGVGWAAVISRDPSALASEMWPVGLGAAAVFTALRRQVPIVLALIWVLSLLTFVLGGRSVGLSVGQGLGVAVESLVIATVLTDRGLRRPSLRSDRDLIRFLAAIAAGGVAAALVSMLVLAATGGGSLRLIGLGTLVGHTSSALFLLPFFLHTDEHRSVAGPAERVAQWASAVGLAVAVFLPEDLPALLFALIPVLGWAALRSPLREVLWQMQMVAAVATVLTTFGRGPLSHAPDRFALPVEATGIVLQTFLISCALVVIPLSLAVGQQIESARMARVERDKVRQIVHSAHVAIIGTDEVGRVVLFNPGAERLLGYEQPDVIGQFTTMFHREAEISRLAVDLGVVDDFVNVALALAAPGQPPVDIKFIRKDGSERTHSMTLSKIVDDRGIVIGYVSTSEDVQERVEVHEALVEALETERRAVERLREVDQVKETFVSAVSHELRTPITSIVGFLEMLQDGSYGELNPQQAVAVGRVNSNSLRLLSLIDELLTLSRVQQDGLGLERREIDLVDVVRTAYDVVAPAWSTRLLDVRVDLPTQRVPCLGDEDMLERVVVNLLGNAVKFTPEGGRVRLVLSVGERGAVIEVDDSGIGIPLEEQPLLFTRFFRASTAQARAIPGSGLGLSIARHIVEMHGGSVSVESGTAIGTTFRVELPVTSDHP